MSYFVFEKGKKFLKPQTKEQLTEWARAKIDKAFKKEIRERRRNNPDLNLQYAMMLGRKLKNDIVIIEEEKYGHSKLETALRDELIRCYVEIKQLKTMIKDKEIYIKTLENNQK